MGGESSQGMMKEVIVERYKLIDWATGILSTLQGCSRLTHSDTTEIMIYLIRSWWVERINESIYEI